MEKILESEFNIRVIANSKPVLVDIYADWCQPCKMIVPILEKLATEFENKIDILKLDGEASFDTLSKYQVSSIPTLLLFKNGKIQNKLVGLQSLQTIKEAINKLI